MGLVGHELAAGLTAFGLVELRLPDDLASESTVVFITDDAKEDWMSSGIPHPTLLGEVSQLTGRTFEIFGMDAFMKIAQEN